MADRTEATLEAFTRPGDGPRATFPLVLAAVTVAVLALHLDAVIRYSEGAFSAGVVGTAVLAAVAGRIVSATREPRARLNVALVVPAMFGAAIGVLVQAIVLAEVGIGWTRAVRDLGGLVDTTRPVLWLASGVVLGGVPAMLVSVFLVLAARMLRRATGHDASERFTVPFTGASGIFAAIGLMLVAPNEAAPLVVVCALAAIALLVTWLVDGSRMTFLRDVFSGRGGAFEIVPAAAFASNPSLAPLVAAANGGRSMSVLVRVAQNPGSYRAAAHEPIALVPDTVDASLRPLRMRRLAAAAMLVAMLVLGLGASAVQGL